MAGYSALHRRVRAARGKAAEYRCVHCGGQATDWAQQYESSGEDPFDYFPLCRKCHFTYDGVWDRNTGRVRTKETRARMSEAAKARGPRTWTKESRDKVSAAMKGRVSPTKGMKHSDETRAKMRAAHAKRLGR